MKITIDRSLVEQALERLALYHHNNGFFDDAVVITALRAALAEPVEPDNGGKTGWPPGLLQDDCRGLSKWLASRPDARQRLREALAEQAQDTDCHAQGICQRSGYSLLAQRKPLSVTDLQDALVYTCLIDRDAIEDPEGYDTGSTVAQINALHEILTRKPT